MSKRNQPEWKSPESSNKSRLRLYNSLTRNKEIFTPQFGNKVSWYSCGPTVYDAAHMGHARSYISFDILRRILSEYFGYDVFYVMNITDIDDKIIKRARQNFLFEQYYKNSSDVGKVISDVLKSLEHYKSLLEKAEDPDKKTMYENTIQKTENSIKNAENSLSSDAENQTILEELMRNSKDTLSEWLDKLQSHTEYDNSIFFSLPAFWEEAFYKDMDALNVLPPDAVTRVTEYIPEILTYVEKIIENGLAYESNGSVYFDTMKFNQMPNHSYGKLVPEAVGDLKKLQEGEGDLSVSPEKLGDKKSPRDFALWKSSKPGEPSWDSPWGKGRPGWHIECSVMASALLGESMDIHTGGVDLKFPHHDNELAQSEAYFNNDQWVRYFLHSGHLTISGCKMSKSLKNFITIDEALQKHTARQIRLAFLLHSWKDTLDYSPQTLDIALHYENLINEFFLNVEDTIEDLPNKGREAFQKLGLEERNLYSVFQQKQDGVHESLCDNVDTRGALKNIKELITSSNIYINGKNSKKLQCDRKVLTNIMAYISKILKIFGADFGDRSQEYSLMPYLRTLANFWENVRQYAKEIKATSILKLCDELRDDVLPALGIRLEDQEGLQAAIKLEKEITQKVNREALRPYLRTLANFRENVRQYAKEIKATSILKLCDELRDDELPALGVQLADQEGQKASIKLEDSAVLARKKEIKQKMEAEKKLEKERKKLEQEKLKDAREAAKKIPPSKMFTLMTDKYSKFDEKGIPTHDVSGKELSESQLKKVMKLYSAQEKKHNEKK